MNAKTLEYFMFYTYVIVSFVNVIRGDSWRTVGINVTVMLFWYGMTVLTWRKEREQANLSG